jgi:hypothetical protein
MPPRCPATPAGLGSARSRWRAGHCEHGPRLASAATAIADGHGRRRSERPLRSTRTLVREAFSCLVASTAACD